MTAFGQLPPRSGWGLDRVIEGAFSAQVRLKKAAR
jgi:hypothetical protein